MATPAPPTPEPIVPGATIGVLGGGQLGRMLALAAARLGYDVHVFCPEANCPAARVAAAHTMAAYDDAAALAGFAAAVDVVTIEFENIPCDTLARLAARVPVRPGVEALRVSQDRRVEKAFLNRIDAPTTAYRAVASADDLARAVAEIGAPALLKTAQFGYDGKGQHRLAKGADLAGIWRDFGAPAGIVEGWVDFSREISVIVARGVDGAGAAYDVVENRHEDGILRQTTAPADIPEALAARARALAGRIAAALDLVGLLAVEMFVTRAGGLLVNEIAPRPHNSGHWTIDACATSQFAQCVRAVCGLPLGATTRHSDAIMTNLIGEDVARWPALLADPAACLHLYGKAETRPGRKMGHVTRLSHRRSAGADPIEPVAGGGNIPSPIGPRTDTPRGAARARRGGADWGDRRGGR